MTSFIFPSLPLSPLLILPRLDQTHTSCCRGPFEHDFNYNPNPIARLAISSAIFLSINIFLDLGTLDASSFTFTAGTDERPVAGIPNGHKETHRREERQCDPGNTKPACQTNLKVEAECAGGVDPETIPWTAHRQMNNSQELQRVGFHIAPASHRFM